MKVIIIGAGEVGFHIARRLSDEAKDVVIIDTDGRALKKIIEYVDVQTVEGSGAVPRVLKEAGIRDADVLLAVTDSDEINVIACMFADALSPNLVKLARIREDEYVTMGDDASALDILHIDKAINPDVEVVRSVKRLVDFPQAEEISEFAGGKIKLVGYRIKEDSSVIGTALMNLRHAVDNIDVIIAAIVRDEKLIIPSGEDQIRSGDLVYFVCGQEHIHDILERLGSKAKPVRRIMIIGGGDIGLRLARELENRLHVRIIDQDPDVCEFLSQTLNKSIVLSGDGRDQDLLREENVQEMDFVVTLTGDEETNILTSLLARNLGAKRTVTRINKPAYLPLVGAIGIDNTISPRQSAVNSILRYMRKGKVISATTIKGDEAEALEAIAQEGSNLVGTAIKDLKFTKGTLILSLQRGDDVIFPSGDTVINPGDRILLLSTRKNISKLEKRLTGKVEFF